MHHDLKRAWIDALHSGNFVQGEGRFCNVTTLEPVTTKKVTDDGVVHTTTQDVIKTHCCLGVLAEIITASPLFRTRYEHAALVSPEEFNGDGKGTTHQTWSFGPAALTELGLEESTQSLLMKVNDFKGDGGFELIARLIEDLVVSDYLPISEF